MFEVAIFVCLIAVLGGMSLWANRQFSMLERLPMQWSLTGKVNWSASRRIALMFTPILATVTLAYIGMTLSASGVLGSKASFVTVTAISGCFVGVHALHFYLISRTLRR
jgi:hypothetical protein